MPDRETLSLVIVGHVDHGKSTLIGRLLYDTESLAPEKMEEIRKASQDLGHEVEFAYVMDQLEEERANEMTFDTAQTFFKTRRRDYVIIDAPGHRELMKNMVTGAAQAEAAILVLDAAEGLREQTRRHAHFLSLLGIRQVAVLINKMDKAQYDRQRFEELSAEMKRFLGSVGIEAGHCVPGSALRGENILRRSDNMPWYQGPTILEALDSLEAVSTRQNDPLTFPVQDVYSLHGQRALVGRVESGRIEAGQALVFLPSGFQARVRTIERFGESRATAEAGECIGITLDAPHALDRGEVACARDRQPVPTSRFRATVFWMSPTPCSAGERVVVRATTQQVLCTLKRIENRTDSSSLEILEEQAGQLQETEVATVTFEAENSLVLYPFGRLPEMGRVVIDRGPEMAGGGLVSEVEATA